MTAPAIPPRNERVDILRGVAIVCVLVLHFTLGYGLKDSLIGDIVPAPLLAALALNGNYGVTMFFAISGFLITSLSLRRWGGLERIELRAFYGLRATRILPPLLPVLAVIVLLGTLGLPHFANKDGGHDFPSSYFVTAVGSVLTFWHNVLMQQVGYFNYCLNIYWSLSVEEAFYLLMPLICVGLRRKGLLLAACAVFIALGPWYRARHADDEIFYMYADQACFDAITFGCLAAFAAHRRPLAGRPATVLRWTAGLALLATYLAGIRDHVVWGFTAVGAASACLLYASAHAAPPGRATRALSAPLRWLGRHTYELYLTHIVVLGGMLDALPRSDLGHAARLPWMAAFLAASCLTATLLARLTQPLTTALRRRLATAP